MELPPKLYMWQRQKLYPNSGKMLDTRNNEVDVAGLVSRLSLGMDIFSHLRVAEYTPIVEQTPLPSISQLRNRIIPEGGAVDIHKGEIRVNGLAEKVTLLTRDHGRYLPGTIGVAGIGVRFEDKSVGTYEFGYGNGSTLAGNRTGMRCINGEFSTFVKSGGVEYYNKPRSEWLDPLDGTGPSGIVSDLNSVVLRILFGWYGYLSTSFVVVVSDPVKGDREVVVDISGGTDDKLSIEQPNLPIFAEADGGTLYVGGRQYGVYGRYNPSFRSTSSPSVNKTVGSAYEPVVSFLVKDTEVWRGVRSQVSNASLLTTENCEYAIFLDATLVGANFGGISGVPFDETALTIDTSATAISSGIRVYSNVAQGGQGRSSSNEDVDLPSLIIPRGSVVTLAARAIPSGTTVINAVLIIKEEF